MTFNFFLINSITETSQNITGLNNMYGRSILMIDITKSNTNVLKVSTCQYLLRAEPVLCTVL